VQLKNIKLPMTGTPFVGFDRTRRALEMTPLRKKSEFSFTRGLAAMGDFNMPLATPGDPILDALTKLGLEIPDDSTQIASSIMSDSHYDLWHSGTRER